MSDDTETKNATENAKGGAAPKPPRKDLPPAALRALAEAEERRRNAREAAEKENERGGPSGPEPTRYGDWESKGRAIDFS